MFGGNFLIHNILINIPCQQKDKKEKGKNGQIIFYFIFLFFQKNGQYVWLYWNG
jgi:hypothetical protein